MKTPSLRKSPSLLFAFLVCLLPGLTMNHADAALIGYEPFDYPTGQTVVGNDGGSGFSSTGVSSWSGSVSTNGAPVTNGTANVVAGSLSYPGMATTGGKLTITPPAGFTTVFRQLSKSYSVETVYVSFLMDIGSTGAGTVGLGFNSSALGNNQQLFIGQFAGSSNWSLRLTNTTIVNSSVPITTGVTLVVAKIQLIGSSGKDIISLFINPTSSVQPETPDLVYGNVDIGAFDKISFTSGASTVASFDEFRMGSTFADVAPIPEPSTTALLGLGVFSIAMLARWTGKGRTERGSRF